VDETTFMQAPKRRRQRHGETEECPHLHRSAEKVLKRFAAAVFEHQDGPATLAEKFEWHYGPRAVQLVF
jgi:hypothetical protein